MLLLVFSLGSGLFFGYFSTASAYRDLPPSGGPELAFENAVGAVSPFLVSSEGFENPDDSLPALLEGVPESVLGSFSLSGSYGISNASGGTKYLKDPYFSFILPVLGGKNWGKLHSYNAVDISASCGAPILASADGIVTLSSSENFWNGGYGNYLVLRHENGMRTKYAHNLKNLAKKGETVRQGDRIALVGNSGNVSGDTGCHVHFEVYGGENPFVK